LWVAVGVLIGVYLLAVALSTLVRLQQPNEFLYGESVVLAQVRRLDLGQPLYPPETMLPLSVTAYTPVYYLVVALLQHLTPQDDYLVGRLVSVAAALGAALLVLGSVRAVAGGWWGGLLAAGLFLTQNLTVSLWAPIERVDMLALCLTLAGLFLSSTGRTTLAGLPLALAVLTKQTYVVAIVSVAAQVWPDRRALASFLGVSVGGALLALGVGQVLSGGWLLWHVVVANANPLDFEYFSAMFNSLLQLNAVPVIIAALLLATPSLPRERQWRVYFVLSAVAALLTMSKLGASSNYWLELTAATAALIGIQAVRLSREPHGRVPLTSASLAALVLAALLTATPGYAATVKQVTQLAATDPATQMQAANWLAQQDGDVLTDSPGLAVEAGKPVEFEFIIFTILAAQHVWNEQPILDAITARHFSLIMLTEPVETAQPDLIAARWSPAVQDAIEANYALDGQQGAFWVYRPRGQAASWLVRT
jgi:hypothetical protein